MPNIEVIKADGRYGIDKHSSQYTTLICYKTIGLPSYCFHIVLGLHWFAYGQETPAQMQTLVAIFHGGILLKSTLVKGCGMEFTCNIFEWGLNEHTHPKSM